MQQRQTESEDRAAHMASAAISTAIKAPCSRNDEVAKPISSGPHQVEGPETFGASGSSTCAEPDPTQTVAATASVAMVHGLPNPVMADLAAAPQAYLVRISGVRARLRSRPYFFSKAL